MTDHAVFANDVNAGSQIGRNTGSIVNHFYGPVQSDGGAERAPKRRKTCKAGAGGQQGQKHTAEEEWDDKYNKLRRSLLFDRMDFRVKNTSKALLTTCDWLLAHPDFRTWYENDSPDEQNGFLWIKGKPGCGKSTLMRTVLDSVREQDAQHPSEIPRKIIPYFFNARASASLEKSSLGLYRTVSYIFLESYSPLSTLFMDHFHRKDPGYSGQNWTREELQGFLYDAVESKEEFDLFLLVDALDEAENEDDVRDMISFLVQLSDRARSPVELRKIQVCLSSRHYPQISIGRGLSLIVEEQPGQTQDIEKYISKQLSCQDRAEKGELALQILRKSASVFLWVVLVVKILNKLDDRGASFQDMQVRLDTIPAGLDELFHEILVKGDRVVETSVLLFQWMIFGRRALEPDELYLAIEYGKSPQELTKISVPPASRLARFILNYSHGLVEIVESTPSRRSIVQFIHETVSEFLMGNQGLASIVPALKVNLAGISHETLRIACVGCISRSSTPEQHGYDEKADFQDDEAWQAHESDVRLKLPFLSYAVLHLFDHAEQARMLDVCQKAFLKTQIDNTGNWSDPCRLWWNVLQSSQLRKLESGAKLLHLIIEREYLNLIPALLDVLDMTDIVPCQYSTTLYSASFKGHLQVVRWLLEKRVHLKSPHGTRFGRALQAASQGGHEKIVRMLLGAGADATAERWFRNALRFASEAGNEEITQILADSLADSLADGRTKGD